MRFFELFRTRRRTWSPASRKASTSRRRAPTRSTASSTAISPPAASASRAWGRSRSPASPTPWAGARSAGSPTSLPRIWVSRRKRLIASAASGGRRTWRGARASRPCRCSRRSSAARSRRCGSWRPIRRCRCRARRAMREALGKLDLFVVSDNVAANDTINAGAHILLPAAAWGEKDGTVTNSERRISRQRTFLPAARRGQTGLVDRLAGRASHGLSRRVRL